MEYGEYLKPELEKSVVMLRTLIAEAKHLRWRRFYLRRLAEVEARIQEVSRAVN